MTPYEREEKVIEQQYERGEISLTEYRKVLRDLQREEQGDIQERAENAYWNVIEGG